MGEIDINLVLAVTELEGVKEKSYKNLFSIKTPSRDYIISSFNAKDRTDWIEAINKTISFIRNPSLLREKQEEKMDIDQFNVLSLIGKGAFGKVMLVEMKSDHKKYALKMIEKKKVLDMDELEHTMNERNILMKLKNPFLVNLYYSFQSPTHVCCY